MYDREKLIVVKPYMTTTKKAVEILLLVFTIVDGIMALFSLMGGLMGGAASGALIFAIPFVLFLAGYLKVRAYRLTEYEYTYYDGDIRIAKIKNKARRKNILNVNMGDIMMLAPAGDRGIYKYENDKNIKVKKTYSTDPEAEVYELVCKVKADTCLFKMELTEEFLDAICKKYPSQVVRKKAN